jgi:LysM repeat protein
MKKNIIVVMILAMWLLLSVGPALADEPEKSYNQLIKENAELRLKSSGQIVSTYRIGKGDSLAKIAAKVGVNKNDLVSANPGIDFSVHLNPGTVIRYPVDMKREIEKTNSTVSGLKDTIATLKDAVDSLSDTADNIAESTGVAVTEALKPLKKLRNDVIDTYHVGLANLLLSLIILLIVINLVRVVRKIRAPIKEGKDS